MRKWRHNHLRKENMKKYTLLLFAGAALLFPRVGQSATVLITDLGSQTIEQSFNTGVTATNIFETGGLRNGDATFAFTMDFSAFSGGNQQVVFEAGGHTNGFSLVYETGDVLRMALTGAGQALTGTTTLSAGQLAAGDLSIVATVQVDNSGDETIGLFIDGTQVINETGVNIGNDWAGANNSGFGAMGGSSATNIAGNYSPVPVALSDGVVNGTYDYYRDVYVVAVPEPSTYALLLIGAGSLYLLRRRKN